MDRPTLGSIRYMGEEITGYGNDKLAVFRRDNCGFVFQQNYLNDTMSVMDNIMVSGLLKSREKKAISQKAKELLFQVGLDDLSFRKFPSQLSGGEAQRVAIVRALINNPKVLFADVKWSMVLIVYCVYSVQKKRKKGTLYTIRA